MEKQKREFESFKTEYNTMKTEYDTIAAKEDDGTITPGEITRMGDLETLYMANQA